uniref:C-type lectin domain-containing protein n=1 Tax=Chelonoidis abingdonii TaxID=106734 RepID=A0A8C0J1Y5_CHEAB
MQLRPSSTQELPQPRADWDEEELGLRWEGKDQHWIGLRREQELGQPWKWANGTEFNNLFGITADGDCAYLNDENRVSSLRCTSERHWICSKPDAFTKAKEAAVEGGSQQEYYQN